jgi:ribosome-binding factor A
MSTRDQGRDLRVADFIRDELAAIVMREMRDPRIGMVSINEVRVSRDLSYADVYVSSLQADTDDARRVLTDVLNRASGFLRSQLARRHTMRTTPKLRFHCDELVERGPRLDALIERAVRDDAARAAGRVAPEQPSSGDDDGAEPRG